MLLSITSLFFSSGCDVSDGAPSVEKIEVAAAESEIDAGVIFRDRSSYLCVPLSRFGISSSENIELIVSSCECVKPSLVTYADITGTMAVGALFEFISEEASSDTGLQPLALGIVVTYTMNDGEIFTIHVNMLLTTTAMGPKG